MVQVVLLAVCFTTRISKMGSTAPNILSIKSYLAVNAVYDNTRSNNEIVTIAQRLVIFRLLLPSPYKTSRLVCLLEEVYSLQTILRVELLMRCRLPRNNEYSTLESNI